MKKLIILILGLLLFTLLPHIVLADAGVTLHTDNATGITGTDATMNGEVTVINFAYFVQSRGFCWDTVSHPANPGDTDPAISEYHDYWTEGGHWDAPFSLSLAFSTAVYTLTPGVTYYFRFLVDRNNPGDWVYGDELSFTATPSTITTADAMYEVWGQQRGAGHPAWYTALPSFLKLAWIGWVLAMAVFMLRTKTKEEEQGFTMPDMKE